MIAQRISRRLLAALLAFGLLGAGSSVIISTMADAGEPPPTFGVIPDGFTGTTRSEVDRLPDYIAVAGARADSVVGYVLRENLFPEQGPAMPRNPEEVRKAGFVWRQAFPVYDKKLQVVGYWADEVGFVPMAEAKVVESDPSFHIADK